MAPSFIYDKLRSVNSMVEKVSRAESGVATSDGETLSCHSSVPQEMSLTD